MVVQLMRSFTNFLSRNTTNNLIVSNIFCHHSTGTYHSTFADMDILQYDSTNTNPYIVINRDW